PLERVRLPFRRPSNGNDRSGPALSQLILEKVPLVVMALASSVITVIAQKTSGAVGSIQQFSVSSRIQNALVSYAVYLLKMAWPTRLAIFYPFPKSPLPVWQLAFAATVVLIITAAAIWRLGRSKYIAVGWFWYLGTLVPVIGLVQVGSQARADRYAYVPLIGVFVLVAWASAELTGSVTWIRNCLAPASVVILIAFTIVTFRQVGYWSDTATLFGHADDVTENNFLAESSLGALLAREGRLSEATEELNRALQANPYYSLSYLNLGMVCVQEGNLDGGIQNFRTAIEYDSKLVDAYNKLGAALADAGRLDEAVPYLHKVLEMNPNHPTAYANLGSVFERQGKPGEALRCYEKALRLISEDQLPSTTAAADLMSAEINDRAGNLLARQGRLGEAANHFREALRFNPADSGAEQRLKAVLDLASQTPAPK
ncbi:MAG TPA: tetratricopeptide repeat protein, partial [Blastocatellia bacterium]|nr:tetratricopeptide repeat protein [Blastocatellia bacterium]